MPEHLVINQFSGGWAPSDDAINGRKNILLRMNNVELDKNGAIKLSRGCSVVQSGYPSEAHTLYSRFINLTRHDYAALTDGSVYRDGSSIASGGNAVNAAFGTAFDYVLFCSGDIRKKDDGATVLDLGLEVPTIAPTFNSEQAAKTGVIPLNSATVNPVGTVTITNLTTVTYISFETADIPGEAVLQSFNVTGAPFDWTTFADGGIDTPDDYILFSFSAVEANVIIINATLDILLESPGAGGAIVANFYTVSLVGNNNLGKIFGSYFKIKRSDFIRVGAGVQDWSTVYGFRLTVSSPTSSGFLGSVTCATSGFVLGSDATPAGICFRGGSKSKTGTFEYAQMNISRTNSYVAKSELGPTSGANTVDTVKLYINLQEPTDPQVNEIWIFRRGGIPDNTAYYPTIGLLDQWYRVAVILEGDFTDPWLDDVSDQDALTENITVNLNLISIASTSIAERIIDIVGPVFGRWYYFTEQYMYPSDLNDPDLVDASQAIRITGSDSEIFLWARAISEAVILVGTSCDIYVLTGTFATLPDNTVDIYYRPLSVAFPPWTNDAIAYNGYVYYLANDGWRAISSQGDNPLFIAPNIDRLYHGEDCYGYDHVILNFAPGSKRFPITIAKNKLWCNVYGINHTQVYDHVRKYWRVQDYGLGNIVAATSTQDGRVLLFYGADKTLREVDDESTYLIDGVTKQTVDLLFPVYDGGIPKNRKDNYILKVRCHAAAGSTTGITIIDENGTEVGIGSFTTGTVVADVPFDIEALLPMCKTWQFKITGAATDFTLNDITLDYDVRPTQVAFLRILPNNYGTPSRKRIYEVPLMIDTLGNNVTITPVVDGVSQTALTVNSSRKQTFQYQFVRNGSDILKGVDYEYLIESLTGMFEFFGFNDPQMETLPEPIRAFVIPPSNFGNACKKRLRVWPFVIDPRGGTLTFLPIVDGTAISGLAANYTHNDKLTVRHQYTSDVFGVDYSGIFYSTTPFEIHKILDPDIVQTLPIAKRFDQVGPEELFRYGRIKSFEYRVMTFGGTTIPYVIYFNDNSTQTGNLTAVNGKEVSIFEGVPKGTSGNIVRMVFGPTAFDFHRFYIRLQVFKTGRDTELEWISLPIS